MAKTNYCQDHFLHYPLSHNHEKINRLWASDAYYYIDGDESRYEIWEERMKTKSLKKTILPGTLTTRV